MTTSPVVSITDELIAELEAAANAATPGPWSSSDAIPERSFCGQVWDASESALLCHDKVSSQATADVRFVSQANPATILALLAERADLKQQLAAASPTAESYELLRQEAKRWRDIVRSVASEIPHRSVVRGNAPGHGHEVPGVWDSDNGPLSGKECAWCKTWHSALGAARNIGSGD